MEVISSKANKKIVETKKLLDKKYRDKTGYFLIETKKVIFEALDAGLMLKTLFILKDKENLLNHLDFLKALKKFNIKDSDIFYISQSVLKEISSVVSSDGYVAVFEKPKYQKKYVDGNFLILDKLQNPDNMGAIMRTALASGFTQIFVIDCVDEFSPKAIRASMGNQFKLKIIHINYEDVKTIFKNINLFTASMEGKNVFNLKKLDKNIGLVIGNEGNGVSLELKKQINNTISIPMKNGVESLNASISASILMYYISQNQKN